MNTETTHLKIYFILSIFKGVKKTKEIEKKKLKIQKDIKYKRKYEGIDLKKAYINF